MTYRLGVDLGTTFTAAAVSNGMPPTMVGLGNRALQIPSVVFLTADGEFVVGESAERRGLVEPDRVVREFKRRIGDSVPILVAGSPYSPQNLTAKVLRHVCETTTERMGSAPEQIVLTHPANWGPYKLELLDQIASLADLRSMVRCPEPVAAANQYAAQNRLDIGDTIAVYDLGGGTFDTCVLRRTSAGFELLGQPEGIEHLGGIDFDEALFRHALTLLGDHLEGLDPDDPETTRGLARLRRDCVEVKEALSVDTDAMLSVTLPGLATVLRLNRAELEGLIGPALNETVDALRRSLRSADVPPDSLSAIVLVGGSSRIPLVGELLHRSFGAPTALDTHPKHDVALGAVRNLAPPPTVPAHQQSVGVGPGTLIPATPNPPPQPLDDPHTRARSGVVAAATAPVGADIADAASPAARSDRPVGRGGSRRRPLVIGVAAAVVIGVVVTGVVVASRPDTGGERLGAGPAPVTDPPSSTTATAPTVAEEDGRPVSTALGPTQLVVTVLTGDNWDLWLADSGQPSAGARLTTDRAPDTTPAISPDRRSIIYTHDLDSDGKRTLMIKGAATPGDGRILFDQVPEECQGTMFRPAWNPVDPGELAVPCTNAGGKNALFRISLEGKVLGAVPLPPGTGRVDDPAYSPDGKRLAYWASPPSTWDGGTLYVVSSTGGGPTELVKSTRQGEDADPVWAPDGEHITFRRRVPDGTTSGNFDIFRVATDGSGDLVRLTDDPADEQDPTYSPTGSSIAYKSGAQDPNRPENAIARTWVMDADGKNKRVLWSQGADQPQTAAAWGRR
jgi:molecular chaperone DnaK